MESKSSSVTTTWKTPFEVSVTIKIPELISSTSSTLGTPTISQENLFSRQPQFSLSESTSMFSLSSLAINTFGWQTALSLAVTSKLVYESKSVVERTAQDILGLNNCKFIDVDDTQCFIASFANGVLIAFRGTESLGDWLSNLNILSTTKEYGVVHKGFYNGFVDVKQFLKQELDRFSPNRILLTGHSLGGALATVAAAEWSESYQITGVYTFGQPAVGKGKFSAFFDTHYRDKFFRFVNNDDIVPRVPPSYQHVGKLFHFGAHSELKLRTEAMTDKVNDIGPKMMSEAEFDYLRAQIFTQRTSQNHNFATESLHTTSLEGLFPSVSSHDLNEYIRKIKAKIL